MWPRSSMPVATLSMLMSVEKPAPQERNYQGTCYDEERKYAGTFTPKSGNTQVHLHRRAEIQGYFSYLEPKSGNTKANFATCMPKSGGEEREFLSMWRFGALACACALSMLPAVSAPTGTSFFPSHFVPPPREEQRRRGAPARARYSSSSFIAAAACAAATVEEVVRRSGVRQQARNDTSASSSTAPKQPLHVGQPRCSTSQEHSMCAHSYAQQ